MKEKNIVLLINMVGGATWILWIGMSFGYFPVNEVLIVFMNILLTSMLLPYIDKVKTINQSLGLNFGSFVQILEFFTIAIAISGKLLFWYYMVAMYLIIAVYIGYNRADLTERKYND